MITISLLIQHHAGPTGDVLIAKNAQGQWEFPKGRAYSTETDAAAAARIAAETLGLTVQVGKLTMQGRKYTKDGTVEHIVCGNITHNTHTKCDFHNYYEAVNIWQTEPKTGVYTEFKYVHPSQLGQIDFVGDDADFMAKYDPWIHGEFIPERRMY